MPVTRTHDFAVAPGKSLISIAEWVRTLLPEEQEAYAIAYADQTALLNRHEEEGYIVSRTDNTVVYSDAAVEEAKKGNFEYVNLAWKAFFDRFQLETGVIYNPNISKS